MEYRYRDASEMKDSGVEWIGMIPKDWDITKFKYVSLLYTGNSIKDSEKDNYSSNENAYPYIGTKDIISDYNKINYNNGMYTKTDDSRFRVAEEGSTLICIEGGSAGKKLSYLNQRVSFVNKLCCIQSNKIYSKFQYYYCNSDSFKKEFSLNLSGLIGGVSINSLNNFRLVNPSLYEQKKIANFLDKKISQFDYIISKKEGLIEKLEEAKKSLISEVVTGKMKVIKNDDGYDLVKRSNDEMKDSGVEWLGEIPKDWEVKKFSHIIKISNGQVNPKIEPYSNMILIAPNHIRSNMGKIIALETANSQGADSGKYFCNKGDIIYSKIRPNLCKVCIAPLDCLCSADMYPMKTDSKLLNQEYLLWILLSDNFTKYVVLDSDRVAMPKVNRESLSKFKIPVPTLQEQNLLNTVLKDKDKNIDCLISKIKLQIEKLKEAKQSLISEAVTGKIEIMD